jgi:uncharacterized protein
VRLWCWAVVGLTLATAASAAPPKPRILLFSGTTGYRHASIEPGIGALTELARRDGFAVTATESAAAFDDLSGYRAIVLLSNTTDRKKPESEGLTGARRDALQRFVRSGGGIVAIHAAADSHYHWRWYGRMIGGRFERHPPGTPKGTLRRVDHKHPASRPLPPHFERVDEWYYFTDYDPTSQLLVTLDPASIGETDANPNPISWAREFEGGRVFYTAMGHTPESYSEALFLRHVGAGLRWAARR